VKRIITIICILGCLFSCQNNKNQLFNGSNNNQPLENNVFIEKFDSLKQIIPIISENALFDFYTLSENGWDWYQKNDYVEIDSLFFNEYVNVPEPLIGYGSYYQTNYFYKIIDIEDGLYNIVTLQRIHNNNEAYMYLIQFDKEGKRVNIILLASLSKSPTDYEVVKSKMNDGVITTYKHYQSDWGDGDIEDRKDTTIYNLINKK